MAYTAKTWVTGEVIQAVDLNHAEQGIAAAQSGVDAISANGAIDTANLANASVTNAKLDQEAVDSDNIRTGAIITPLIYDGAVTMPKLGEDVLAELDNKADIDGSYESMTVGNAEQLVSSVGIEDSTPYNFRTSGGSTEIGDREELNAIVGGTVAWNQLVNTSGLVTRTINGVTFTPNADGTVTVNGTATNIARYSLGVNYGAVGADVTNITNIGNHKTVIMGCPTGGSDSTYYITVPYVGRGGEDVGNGAMQYSNDTVYNGQASITVESGATVNNVVFKPQVFDLTQMFGSTIADYIYALEQSNAGAGVAYFRKLFPKPYYAYNSGELLSVRTNLHRMVGFNQWDEVSEVGAYDNNTGEKTSIAGRMRSANAIRVFPDTAYCLTRRSGGFYCYWYDASGNFIQYNFYNTDGKGKVVVTSPSNAGFLRFYIYGSASDINGVCINLSWDGERNGEYEPYVAHEYAIDDITLRGVLKLDANNNLYADGDRYLPDGTVERRFAERAYQSGDESLADAITDGTTTVYKLTTPTTETADPYQQTQIVDDFGTEEFVDVAVEANERDVAIPVGNVTFYPQNLRKKIEGLPFDFSTLIARTEKTFKATKAYAVNEFLIINNQLYKTRTSIANGATITVGTNVIATTIGAELTAILNS